MWELKESGAAPLLPDGEYDFEVLSVQTDWVSKAGNPGIKFEFMISDGKGKERMLFDYIMKNNPYASDTVTKIIKALGRDDLFCNVRGIDGFAARGMKGRCKVAVEPSTNPQFPDDQNRIKKYIRCEGESPNKMAQTNIFGKKEDESSNLDDLPF